MLAIFAARLDWCKPMPPEVGIFLFFLLFVFSNASYPSGPDETIFVGTKADLPLAWVGSR